MRPQGSVSAVEYWLSAHVANWSGLGTEQRISWVQEVEESLSAQAQYGIERPLFVLSWKFTTMGRDNRYYAHREDYQ